MPRWIGGIPEHNIDPHRALDVFEVLFAQISELDVDLSADMIVNGEGNADAARFCDALKPRRDIDAISKDVMGLDDYVADVDTYTESNTPVLRLSRCKFLDPGLELHTSPNPPHRPPTFYTDPSP